MTDACVYNVKINFLVKLVCPVGSSTFQLVRLPTNNGDPNEVLASVETLSGDRGTLTFNGPIPEKSTLVLLVQSNIKVDEVIFEGSIEKDESCELLKQTTVFDQNLKINYITNRPLDNFPPAPPFQPQFPPNPPFIPWESITIPWRDDQESLPVGTSFPNGNWYDKFQSVQYSVFFYLGIDMFTIPPDSPELTIFIKNFVDRGKNNDLKMVYMSALTSDKMVKYQAKVDTMLNEAYTRFTVNREPVLSAFKDVLIRFFLAIHIGYDDYPDTVIEYFRTFIDIIGFGDPNRPGRNDAMIRGNFLAPSVKEYFNQRNTVVIANNDDTTIAYYWNLAGLPIQSLLIESVHNIIAFSQYNNTLYRLIADKLWATNPPPYNFPPPASNPPPFGGPPPPRGNVPEWFPYPPINALAFPPPPANPIIKVGPIDFFNKLITTPSGPDRLNVVREVYRLLAPNTNAFSKLESETPIPPTQARHIWQQIMIYNQNIPFPVPPEAVGLVKAILYFTYNPNLYNANYRTDINSYVDPPVPPPPLGNFDPRDLFEFSPIDNNPVYGDGTVIQKGDPKFIPVFDTPIYLPFGVAYRRCAGEVLNMFFTEKMIARFADLTFEVLPLPSPPDYKTYQTLAPFTAVPDNIFVKFN